MKKTLITFLGFLTLLGLTYVGIAQLNKDQRRPEGIQPGIVTTASGLKYLIKKEGTGPSPQAGQTVRVHYTGWLDPEGTQKFDSSYDRERPLTFPVGTGRVIKGWDEGVLGMKVGEQRHLIIPYELAYGERGMPPVIPPKATLYFDVELLGID